MLLLILSYWFILSIIFTLSLSRALSVLVPLLVGIAPVLSWCLVLLDDPVAISCPYVELGSISLTLQFMSSTAAVWIWLLLFHVASVVLVYAIWYASSDPSLRVLLALLCGFVGSMAVLVGSEDAVSLFVGWEGIGLASFGLIGHYGSLGNHEAIRSATKAVTFNRLGDCVLLFSVCYGVDFFRSGSLSVWALGAGSLAPGEAWLLSCGFVLGCWAKSAQWPLSPWLADAMTGPTPVSALLHSATLVTAGIVVLFKTVAIRAVLPSSGMLLAGLGVSTAVMASAAACMAYDAKRAIAFSTCTHVGLMVAALGMDPELSLRHLFQHGWSKSLLFLLAGCVLHAVHAQDLRTISAGGSMGSPARLAAAVLALLPLQGMLGCALAEVKDAVLEAGWIASATAWSLCLVLWCSQGYVLGILLWAFLPQHPGPCPRGKGERERSPPWQPDWGLVLPLGWLVILSVATYPLFGTEDSVIDTGEPSLTLGLPDAFGVATALGLSVGLGIVGGHPAPLAQPAPLAKPARLASLVSTLLNRWYGDKLWSTVAASYTVRTVHGLQSRFEMGWLLLTTSWPLTSSRLWLGALDQSSPAGRVALATAAISLILITHI